MEFGKKRSIIVSLGVIGILALIYEIFNTEGNLNFFNTVYYGVILSVYFIYAFRFYLKTKIREFIFVGFGYVSYFIWLCLTVYNIFFENHLTYALQGLSFDLFISFWAFFILLFATGFFRKIQWIISVPMVALVLANDLYFIFSNNYLPGLEPLWLLLLMYICVFFILTLYTINPLYKSKRTRISMSLWKWAAFSIFLSVISRLIFGTVYPDNVLNLVFTNIWAMLNLIIVFYYPEGMLISKDQTIAAVRSFEKIMLEKRQCKVFCDFNLNNYIRDIPENIINDIGDNGLKNVWSLLQENPVSKG